MSSGRAITKLKVALLGNSGVGETYWLKRLLNPTEVPRPPLRDPVAPIDMGHFRWNQKEFDYDITFYNPSQQTKHRNLVESILKNKMDAYIIFYKVNDQKSFDDVEKHASHIVQTHASKLPVLLLGTHFGGEATITQEQAERKAKKLGMHSYYMVDARMNHDALLQQISFIVRNSHAAKVKVPSLNFQLSIDAINSALRYCWDKERAQMLINFKQMLNDFSCFGDEVTQEQVSEMQRECHSIVNKARTILEDAFPERVKTAVLAAATTVLFATAVVCGLALLNIITLPILTSVLITACVLAGAASAFSAGCCLFKIKENIIYSSIVSTAEEAVKDFPGVNLFKQG